MTKNDSHVLSLSPKLMDSVEEEVARFMRKFQELKTRVSMDQGSVATAAPEVGTCRRASQDVAAVLKEFRLALARK